MVGRSDASVIDGARRGVVPTVEVVVVGLIGVGLVVCGVVLAASTRMVWQLPERLNAYEVVSQRFLQGGLFFAGSSGGDDTADLIVGPGVTLVAAAALAGCGAAAVVGGRRTWRARTAATALVVALISLGFALWNFDRVDKFVPGRGAGLAVWTAASLVAATLAAILVVRAGHALVVDDWSSQRVVAHGWRALWIVLLGGGLGGLMLIGEDMSSGQSLVSFAFVLTVVVVSIAASATLALSVVARPGAGRRTRATVGGLALACCLAAYLLLPQVGQVG
jgi:hypothetical protein